MVSTALSSTLKVIYFKSDLLDLVNTFSYTFPYLASFLRTMSLKPCLEAKSIISGSLTSAVSWSSVHTIGFLKKKRRLKLGNSSASKILTLSNFQLTSIFTLHTRGTVA